jgi:hypothetical protein
MTTGVEVAADPTPEDATPDDAEVNVVLVLVLVLVLVCSGSDALFCCCV